MAELVDAHGLGPCAARRAGSTPVLGTKPIVDSASHFCYNCRNVERASSSAVIEAVQRQIVAVKESAVSGKGCFALRPIKQGQTIHILSGELLTGDEVDRRIITGQARVDDELQIGDDQFLALDSPSYFFNHSCNPNGGIRNESELFALKDIAEGEELTYDYSTTVGIEKQPGWLLTNNNWTMECNCGSGICRKQIQAVTSITEITLQRYEKLGALPEFIKRQLSAMVLEYSVMKKTNFDFES